MTTAEGAACIWVLAGTNGAGKSSIGGAMLRQSGGDYFNPDEAARGLRERDPALAQFGANSLAWRIGLRQLDRAIVERRNYFFETTLGGETIAARLAHAIDCGLEVRVWYVGLDGPQAHVQRVAERVAAGGHDIPQETIHKRFDASRRNLVALLPRLTELKVFDNSARADIAAGIAPRPHLLLHWRDGQIHAPRDLSHTPDWAKPIVAQALKSAWQAS